MKPERLNYREREIASMYGIALKKLREFRKDKRFESDICFTAPDSSIVLYNLKEFDKWFQRNKDEAIYTLNQRMQKCIASLKANGFWADARKKKFDNHRVNQLNNMYEQSAELREDYTDHYGRITEIDKKLADEFEREKHRIRCKFKTIPG